MSPEVPFSTYVRRLYLVTDLIGKKRVPYTHLSEKYSVSIRTIKRDVNWIRRQVDLPSVRKALAEKVMGALDSCDSNEDKELILKYCLAALLRGTQEIQVKEEQTITETHRIDINVFSDDEKSILDRAAAILDRKSKGEPTSIH